jgi:polyphosphate glucokinase
MDDPRNATDVSKNTTEVVVAGSVGPSEGPHTLAIDVGGTRLKCGVLDAAGKLAGEPVRVDSPHDDPGAVLETLVSMARPLGAFDRVSVGFPGFIRRGTVLTAPNLGTKAWAGFPLSRLLAERLGKPVRMLNDATVQGLGVIAGDGVELVVTLGTGFGFALFNKGRLGPQLEMSQHPVRKHMTYDQYLGGAAYAKVGKKKWNSRVARVIGVLETVVNFETLYMGGGNAKNVTLDLPKNVRLVANTAGVTGGIKLWGEQIDEVFF